VVSVVKVPLAKVPSTDETFGEGQSPVFTESCALATLYVPSVKGKGSNEKVKLLEVELKLNRPEYTLVRLKLYVPVFAERKAISSSE
jgi:hypothetical protein